MKTLQEKYNAVLEGNFPKSQFVRDAKMEVPRFISPFNGFEDTVQILKNKGMLVEAKAETPEYDKPAPGYPLEALERGVDYELEKAGVDTATETATEGQYENAKKKAEKNLEKDPNFYLHLLSGDSKKVDKHDREVEVDQKKLFKGTVDPKGGKAEGNTDTFNAMKKATLREEFKKEYVADAAEIRQFLEKKLSSNHDKAVVDEVYKELFDGIEFLVDEQPGTSELEAAYSVSENLEDSYYEEEQDEHLAVAQEITKLIEPYFMASEQSDTFNAMKKATLREEFKKEYIADADEIRQFLEKKLSSNHDKAVVNEVFEELFEGIESLVDEQPGTGELDAAYSISENLEDQYYEEEQDEHLAVAQEITKLIEPYFMASEESDTSNAMKKATLREAAMAKGYTKEQVEAAIKRLQEKKGKLNERTDIVPTAELKASDAFKDAGINMNEPVLVLTQDGGHGPQETEGIVSAQEALKMFQRLRAEGMEDDREDHYEFDNEINFHAEGYEYKLSYFEQESTTTALMQKATVSENKAKLNEELAPTGIGISGDQLDKLNKLGAIAGVEVTVQDKDGSNVRKVDYTLTNTSFEKDIDDYDSIAEGDIKEAVKKVIKHVLSEGALDRFSDYEPEISNRTETIQDILGELEQELDVNIDIINGQISKTGGALSPAIQAATKKDLMELVKTYVEKITYVKSQPVDIDGKRLHSIPSVKPLNERVGSLDDFLSLIKDRAVDSEFSEKQEAEEVIEALADHYNIESQSGGDENKDAIKFAQFIHAHGLNDEEIKDEEYLKTLYNNYKENK